MDDENLFEINLTDWTWRWDFIDFWAQPLSQRGVKPEKEEVHFMEAHFHLT
jgi:hypothetical protein